MITQKAYDHLRYHFEENNVGDSPVSNLRAQVNGQGEVANLDARFLPSIRRPILETFPEIDSESAIAIIAQLVQDNFGGETWIDCALAEPNSPTKLWQKLEKPTSNSRILAALNSIIPNKGLERAVGLLKQLGYTHTGIIALNPKGQGSINLYGFLPTLQLQSIAKLREVAELHGFNNVSDALLREIAAGVGAYTTTNVTTGVLERVSGGVPVELSHAPTPSSLSFVQGTPLVAFAKKAQKQFGAKKGIGGPRVVIMSDGSIEERFGLEIPLREMTSDDLIGGLARSTFFTMFPNIVKMGETARAIAANKELLKDLTQARLEAATNAEG